MNNTTNRPGFEEDEVILTTGRGNQQQHKTNDTFESQASAYVSGNAGSAATVGFDALMGLSSVTASGNVGSGNTTELLKALADVQKRVENNPTILQVKVLPVEDPRIPIAIVALWFKCSRTNLVYYSTLMFEEMARPLANKHANIGRNNRSVEIDMFPALFWNKQTREIVENVIGNVSGKSNGSVCASNMVVPKTVELLNINSLAKFYDHALAAISATMRSKQNLPTSPVTVNVLANNTVQLVSKFDVTPGGIYLSSVNQPYVADVNVVLYARQAGKPISTDVRAISNQQDEIALTAIAGYMDFYRRVPTQQAPYTGYPVPTPGYDPVFVITNTSSLGASSRSNDNLLTQLLALPSLLPLLDPTQNKWATIFEPFVGDNQLKPNLGILGLEHDPLPMPQKQFVPKELTVVSGSDPMVGEDKVTAQAMAAMYCTRTVLVAMDIIKGSPTEWLQTLFAGAVPGSKEESIIINELDAYSGGVFSKLWLPKNKPIMQYDRATNSTLRVDLHAGYYTDTNGRARDGRTIDYLTCLSYSAGDMTFFDSFALGFYPGNNSLEDMDIKRNIRKQMAPNFTVTGLISRFFFNNDFINTIEEMHAQCGIAVTIEGLSDMSSMVQRQSFNSEYITPLQGHGVSSYYQRNYNQPGYNPQHYGTTSPLASTWNQR